MATALPIDITRGKAAERIPLLKLTPIGRWLILVGGVLILAAGPAVWGALDPETSGLSAGWAIAAAVGCAIASAISPSIVLVICGTLSWRPAWQRILLFAPALALQIAAYSMFWCENTPLDRGLAVLWMSPLIVSSGGLPAFLWRLWRRWMILPQGNDAQQPPMSIAGLLLATTFWAAAAASARWSNTDGWFNDAELKDSGQESIAMFITFVLFVFTPAAFVGLALVLSLRATMIRRESWAFGAVIALAISVPAIAIGSVVSLLRLVAFQVNDQPISSQELLAVAIGIGSFCVTAFFIGTASFIVLRLLGYRLLHRGVW